VLAALLVAAGLDLAVTGALGAQPAVPEARPHADIIAEAPMTTQHDPRGTAQGQDPPGRGGHGWMMIACCIPVLVIAVVLVVTGVVGVTFLVGAVACTFMMALMMRAA